MMKARKSGEYFKTDMSDHYVRFVDIIFGFTTMQGIILASSPDKYRIWFENIPSNLISISNFMLIYVLLISSWLGYHRSVHYYPIRNWKRFIIDVIIVLLYYVGFVFVTNFITILLIMTISFFLYFIWDWFRIYEYKAISEEQYSSDQPKNVVLEDQRKRKKESLIYFVIMLLVLISYKILPFFLTDEKIGFLAGAYTIIIWVVLIQYRRVKQYN